jgi:iron complex transport system permease protein
LTDNSISYRSSWLKHFIWLFALLVLLIISSIMIGSVYIPLDQIWLAIWSASGADPTWQSIIWDIRMPRALTAVLAGVSLSVAGLHMQTLFRNPLAGPSVLGITSGASLGVAFLVLGGGFATGIYALQQLGVTAHWLVFIFAFLGATVVLFIILFVSFRVTDNVVLLIVGIMVGNITLSLVSIWQYFSAPEAIRDFLIWTFGSFDSVSWSMINIFFWVAMSGFILSMILSKILNTMLLGDQYAISMGVHVRRARVSIILVTALLAGVTTAFCGPIGFVGIAVPHLARAIIRDTDHKLMIPFSALIGAIIAVFCDIIAQLPGSQYTLPINAITALIGSPVVIMVILGSKNLKGAF